MSRISHTITFPTSNSDEIETIPVDYFESARIRKGGGAANCEFELTFRNQGNELQFTYTLVDRSGRNEKRKQKNFGTVKKIIQLLVDKNILDEFERNLYEEKLNSIKNQKVYNAPSP